MSPENVVSGRRWHLRLEKFQKKFDDLQAGYTSRKWNYGSGDNSITNKKDRL